MSTVTGDNQSLAIELLMERLRRNESRGPAWVEAGYCLDAPTLIAAGSVERDEFGYRRNDWIPLPTFVEREAIAKGEK